MALAEARPIAAPRFRLHARPILIVGTVALLSFVILYPIFVLVVNSFVITRPWETPQYGLRAWQYAVSDPGMLAAMWNTVQLAAVHQGISLPFAILIAWLLGRTNIPWAKGLEFFFWLTFFMPTIPTIQAWILLMDPNYGMLNRTLVQSGLFPSSPFNIFSFWGIVWMHLVTSTIAVKVMLFTPAFANLDATMEEASTIAGAGVMRTLRRIVVPLLTPTLVTVLVLALVRAFQAVEIELVLGLPVNYFVFGSKIYDLTRLAPPDYGAATAMGTYVMVLMIPLILLHRHLTTRRRFTTITSAFKPQPIKLGAWRWPAFALVLTTGLIMTVIPAIFLVMGSLMRIYGVFDVPAGTWTTDHWRAVLNDAAFPNMVKNTLILALGGATLSSIVFAIVAYVLVRWRFRLRGAVDFLTWVPAALPGILIALAWFWIFLRNPFLQPLTGTIVALILVSGLSGMTLAVQMLKATLMQMGTELEEAAEVSGGNWLSTMRSIVVPLILPTVVVIWIIHFVGAAGNAILPALLASPASKPLALRQLEYVLAGDMERGSIVGIIILVLNIGVAVGARFLGFRAGLSRIL
jgi:iron(III) transport system permease protein